MPTLDDAPTLETLTEATSNAADLLQIYDVSQQKVKTMSLDEILAYVIANSSATAL